MSTQNNPPKTPELKINDASKQKVDAIKENLASARDTPAKTSEPEKAKPTLTVKILNDDLAGFLNHKKIPGIPENVTYNTFNDGGPLSSQLSISGSFPIQKGVLKGGSLTIEGNATTSTGWAGNDEWVEYKPGLKSPWLRNDMQIVDGYQLPKSENYRLTVMANKPFTLKNDHQLDLHARVDGGYVGGNAPLQDAWHELGNAKYYRSSYNKVQSQALINVEASGAYSLIKNTNKKYIDASLLAGTSFGNTYNGAMAGAEISIGSKDAHYLPQQAHSAQFGNTNPDHLVQTAQIKPGTVKFSAYGKAFFSTQRDFRTNLPASLTQEIQKIPVEIRGERFGNQFLGYGTITAPDGTQAQIAQNKTEIYEEVLNANVPYPIERYQKKAITFEGGLRLQYQVSHSVTLGATLGVVSNLATPVINNAYTLEAEKIEAFLKTRKTILRLNPGDTPLTITPAPGMSTLQVEQFDADPSLESHIIMPPAASPLKNFTGQVTVNIALSNGKKKDSTLGR